jgi:hypothetical protein
VPAWRMQRTVEEEAATQEDRLQRVLMEESDLRLRARAHLELARLSLAEGRVEGSVRHLREALMLDRRLDAARQMLQELGEASRVAETPGDRKGAVRALLGRVRRS